MLSPNLAIRQAYFATLNTITYLGNDVPVFWSQLPTNTAPGIYIIFGQIRNNENSPKTSSMTETSVTVSVYTNALKYNDGVAVEVVANEVLNRIIKNRNFNISLNQFFQIVASTLASDTTNDFSEVNQNVYIDRILTFNHTIFQNVS